MGKVQVLGLAGLLLAGALLAVPAARGAEAETEVEAKEKTPREQFEELVVLDPPPKTREEFLEALTALRPQLEAFAEKYAEDEVGPDARRALLGLTTALGDTKAALAAVDEFVKRFPDHEAVPEVRLYPALWAYSARDYARARELLTAHLKAYPKFQGRAMVEGLLESMKLIGTEAKDFTTTDLDGNAVKLSDFRGKVVLLDFFASWCAPCRDEMPNLVELHAKHRARGFEIVGVSLDKTVDDAKGYVGEAGITWTVTFTEPGGWQNPVARLYEVHGIPQTYLIDGEGKILHANLRGEALAEVLAELFPEPEKEEQDAPEETAPASHEDEPEDETQG